MIPPGKPQSARSTQSKISLSGLGELRGCVTFAAVCVAVLLLFSPTFSFPFLNWDDQDVFVRNPRLHAPGLVAWAFTTKHIEHYQPLAWLTWGLVDRLWGLTPGAAHAVNVVLHAACAAVVFLLARRFVGSMACQAEARAAKRTERRLAISTAAALLFAIHPLRVEVVAWASAMPYALALLFALLAMLAYLAADERPWLIAVSIVLFALSLLARPIALGLPVVLFAIARCGQRNASTRSAGLSGPRSAALTGPPYVKEIASRPTILLLFALLAVIAAYVESTARLTATLTEVRAGARLTLALTAPFRYLLRTIAPINLTPLDPIAIAPTSSLLLAVAAAAALAAVSFVVWHWRKQYPGAAVAWVSYLALLLPAAGLVPSGLQATADRYTYVAAVPLSIWIAYAAWKAIASRIALAVGIGVLAVLTLQQARYWRDSVMLWTRAVSIDPANDVALYNLASALDEAGRPVEALLRYDEVLALVPDHRDARRNGNILRARMFEEDANMLAASGRLDPAIEQYRRAIALDPRRTHSQAALGMALVQTGRTGEALPYLREAIAQGADDPAVSNALAFSLVQDGRTREACEVLEAARAKFPGDANVARNLAQTCSAGLSGPRGRP